MVEGIAQDLVVIADRLRGLVDQRAGAARQQPATAAEGRDDDASRRRAERARQHAFGARQCHLDGEVLAGQRTQRTLRPDEAGQQFAQFGDAGGIGGRLLLKLLRLRPQHERTGLLAIAGDRPHQQRHADQQQRVNEDADHEALADGVEVGKGCRQVGLERRHLSGARGLVQCRQQERVEPDDEAAGQTRHDAVTMGTAPVEAEHEAGREVGHGAERDQADRGQRQVTRDDAFVGVARHENEHDCGPAYEHDQRSHLARGPGLTSQQIGHDQLVADHPRQRHASHDHHRGRSRKPADENEGRQPAIAVGERQLQHEKVGADLRSEEQQPCRRDRHNEQVDQNEIERKQPARRLEARWMAVLDHRDMELARQAEEGHRRQERHHQPAERRAFAGESLGDGRRVRQSRQQIGWPIEQDPQNERPDGQQGEQLDHRFEGDGQHHAAVLLRRGHVAHAEQDGEHGHQRGHDQRRVGVHDAGPTVDPGRRLGDRLEARRHRLELQRDVGQHAHGGEQCGGHADSAALAVAGGEEVGDRRHVVLLGQPHHLPHHRVTNDDHKQRAGIDEDEVEAGRGRAADRAVEGPGRAVDGERQAIDGGRHGTRRPVPGVAVADVRHAEQQA